MLPNWIEVDSQIGSHQSSKVRFTIEGDGSLTIEHDNSNCEAQLEEISENSLRLLSEYLNEYLRSKKNA